MAGPWKVPGPAVALRWKSSKGERGRLELGKGVGWWRNSGPIEAQKAQGKCMRWSGRSLGVNPGTHQLCELPLTRELWRGKENKAGEECQENGAQDNCQHMWEKWTVCVGAVRTWAILPCISGWGTTDDEGIVHPRVRTFCISAETEDEIWSRVCWVLC